MRARKGTLRVARGSLRQRLIELGKDVLIVLLTCSAVYLAGLTPMMIQLRSWISPAPPLTQPQPRQARESVIPYGVAVRNSLGLYGVSYDQAMVEGAFEQVAPLIGEALTTVGTAESITPRQWRQLLDGPGIYCQFQGRVPLPALSAWLGEGEKLSGNAQVLVLGWDGAAVRLGWQDGNSRFWASTGVAYEGHMSGLLEEFTPNGAAFAYTLRESDKTYDTLDSYVLIAMTGQRPMTYTVSSPDFMGDREALGTLLDTLDFRSGVGSAYEAAGEMAINENGDRLRVNAAGRVVFRAGEETRYPVSAVGDAPTVQEAALAAWEVLNRAAEPWKGETSYVLTGAEETGEGWTVTFQARLGGIPVYTGQEGWCARFVVEGGRITDFTIDLRSYAATGVASLVTTERLAAAVLKSKPGSGGQLELCYQDNRTGTMAAGWIAGE